LVAASFQYDHPEQMFNSIITTQGDLHMKLRQEKGNDENNL